MTGRTHGPADPSDSSKDLSSVIEAIRWLMFEDRRPGMVGPATSIEGVDPAGKSLRLRRLQDRWILEPDEVEVSTNQVARLLAEGEFRPTRVVVKPELAALYFQAAVEQAQASVRVLLEAERLLSNPEGEGLDEDEDDVLLFVLVAGNWDKCLRFSSAAVILAVSAAEAQINDWLDSQPDLATSIKKPEFVSLKRKIALLSQHSKKGQLSAAEERELDRLLELRNQLVHSHPQPEAVPLASPNAPQPGYWLSLEARRACVTIRKVLTRLARGLGMLPPRYLAFTPPVDPTDDDEWARAVLFTGARDDPDFPRAGVISSELESP